jgi:signal transduction histidine kinase
LIQVAVNLIQNAVKYTPEDSEISCYRIIVMFRPYSGRIQFGNLEDLEKIFDPFFRVQGQRRTQGSGWGSYQNPNEL